MQSVYTCTLTNLLQAWISLVYALNILMGSCKMAVTPLPAHCSYCSLAPSHRYICKLTGVVYTVKIPLECHQMSTMVSMNSLFKPTTKKTSKFCLHYWPVLREIHQLFLSKHCNGNVILMKSSSLAPPKVVILATFGVASDENFIKIYDKLIDFKEGGVTFGKYFHVMIRSCTHW